MKKIYLLIVVSCQLSVVSGQSSLSGSLNLDSKISFDRSEKIYKDETKNVNNNKKSPLLAGVLSFAVPGAGEFYSESYIKSAVFVALEAAAITIGLIYDKKGNDQTNFFQNYADGAQGWSVLRYAQWTLIHIKDLNPNLNRSDYENKVIQNGKVNWNELHILETAVAGRNGQDGSVPGSYYSHNLPLYGEQQYYELIGKYPQFAVGWYEFSGTDLNKPFVYGDPLPQQFLDYSKMRGDANDFYNVASKAVIVVVVNHIISALDAAWSAHGYNSSLQMHASIEKYNTGFNTVYYPQLNLQYSF
ncbi:MAG: hypothetical protein NTZ27_05980 [Ignavibacteriales bacterium]|nr:hypothetical protein [Ignavibacteriales bacterium]